MGAYSQELQKKLIGPVHHEHRQNFYQRMYFIRRFEETLLELFDQGLLNGTTHACIGQEANAVGVISHLRSGDHIFSNHRCHGHYLAWSGDALGLAGEIIGNDEGICGGIGGSQHLCREGFKSNGIQGGIVPAATGIALAMKLQQQSGISVVFIGDGTLGQGVVYESANIASLWQVPLLIVLENNEWAQSTPIHLNFAGSITERFASFGIEHERISSTEVDQIHEVAHEAVSSVRERRKPFALIIDTYRLCHHSKNDDNRPQDEVEERAKFDPILLAKRHLTPEEYQRLEHEVDQHLTCVFEQAQAQSIAKKTLS